MGTASRRKAQMMTGVLALGILGSALITSEPEAAIQLHPETVVADFGAGAVQPAAITAALQAQRAAPGDLGTATKAAGLMIDEGRAKGDSRLVGAALAILHPFVAQGVPQAQVLAATARQYQHDFAGALALLDLVLARQPRDTTALLNRATLYTVQGKIDPALQDCAAIAAIRSDVGFLCQATALTMTNHAPVIAARLEAILAEPGLLDEGLQPWARSLLGEIAMLQGEAEKAISLLERVLQDDPGALRERLMLADLWQAAGAFAQVLDLLKPAPDTDGVQIRRVLAMRAMGQDTGPQEAALALQVQRNLDIGLTAHAREEAMYFLLVANNPAAALARAEVNWGQQHEYDDLRLLLEAAAKAGRPEAAKPALDWTREANIAIPALVLPASVQALAGR